MKLKPFTTGVFALVFLACSNDDMLHPVDESLFLNQWRLSGAETNRPIDFNGDSVYNSDIIEDCEPFMYDIFMTLYEDGTFWTFETLPHPDLLYYLGLPVNVTAEYKGNWYYNAESRFFILDYQEAYSSIQEQYVPTSRPTQSYELIDLPVSEVLPMVLETEFSDLDGSYLVRLKFHRLN